MVRLGGGRSYPIRIGDGGFAGLEDILKDVGLSRSYGVVTDRRIEALYGERIIAILKRLGVPHTLFRVPRGEGAKDLHWASWLYDRLLGKGFERGSALLALGGGSVGDLAGFVAATCLRGIPYLQIPTTLLAQVDSSVGGKTGVNHPLGKNLIGAFYQPRGVYIDLGTLSSLPERDYRSGFAEVVKYGTIGDRDLFQFLEEDSNRDALLRRESDATGYVVARSCRQKARVVERDEREGGVRAILNFGHTFGHAVEKLSGYGRFRHGEAVAIGMTAAATMSARMGFCSGRTAQRLRTLLALYGLPTRLPSALDAGELGRVMARDKKVAGGNIRFVVLRRIGEVGFESLPAKDAVESVRGA